MIFTLLFFFLVLAIILIGSFIILGMGNWDLKILKNMSYFLGSLFNLAFNVLFYFMITLKDHLQQYPVPKKVLKSLRRIYFVLLKMAGSLREASQHQKRLYRKFFSLLMERMDARLFK